MLSHWFRGKPTLSPSGNVFRPESAEMVGLKEDLRSLKDSCRKRQRMERFHWKYEMDVSGVLKWECLYRSRTIEALAFKQNFRFPSKPSM